MRRIASRIVSAIAAVSLGLGAFAGIGAAASGAGDVTSFQDVAQTHRIGHQMVFDVQGAKATLDGQAVAPSKSVVKDGRVFIPLRLLGTSGTASSIKWDAEKREAHIVMKPQVTSVREELVFRPGKEQLFTADGTPFSAEKIPAPFVKDGLTYIPVKPLAWLGISAVLGKGTMTWQWNANTIRLLTLGQATDQEYVSLSILNGRNMGLPNLQIASAEGSWSSVAGAVMPLGFAQAGELYDRVGFTVKLSPGLNRVRLSAASGETVEFAAIRTVPSGTTPVPLTEAGQRYLKLEAPLHGYLTALDGVKLRIAGTAADDAENRLRIDIRFFQYVDRAAGTLTYGYLPGKQIAIRDRAFESEIPLEGGPGFYLVKVESSKLAPSGAEMTAYAQIMVETKPNAAPPAGSDKSYRGYKNEDDPSYVNAVKQGEMPPPLLSDGWLSEDLLKRIHGISLVAGKDGSVPALPNDYYLMLDAAPSRMLLHAVFPEGWRSQSSFSR
ncbi:hypothetical protein SAMN02799624_06008 [Paenibacillus sp. UNC496MF]|uniref:hypothetical protein n=1 Tax=Paenibacillus sp. UNC496MF TaxID=1502753 RepID=UPI0008E4B443|nr:hypothetical protein [Paenibacillus sp. UNC496MF]SFJ79868.1 hypothetical protein SAMN02799624_06008 [Paenibacillus sp. UNC496MF]